MKKYSRCGLNCGECPAFLAYLNNDDKLRQKTAKKWALDYQSPDIKPEDINCKGCLSKELPVYNHCLECKVRLCGIKKGLDNCGQCDEYKACQIIASLHKEIPEGKIVCDKINS